jgi:Fe-Mn family superoxide dismutase
MSAHVLPKLPYSYDALEPHIDARTMEIHHTKHHQAYVNNLNNALDRIPKLQAAPLDVLLTDLASVPEEIRTAVRNNGGGHDNHSFFWRIMGREKGGRPQGPVAEAITDEFQTYENFQEKFAGAAMARFGSGWAWLSLSREGRLTVHSTPNQDSPRMEGLKPILGLDVWEHAYYLKYQNRRTDYVQAFWNVVDWEAVNENLLKARR